MNKIQFGIEIRWKKYGKSFREFSKEFEEKLVGMFIEVDNKIVLIGDVNEAGGICDDCMYFDRDDIVTKYSRPFDVEELISHINEQ